MPTRFQQMTAEQRPAVSADAVRQPAKTTIDGDPDHYVNVPLEPT